MEKQLSAYEHIAIIANPVSRRNGEKISDNLQKALHKKLPDIPVVRILTEDKLHARELACFEARKGKGTLIISVSGDGMYNEVVNGVKDANQSIENAPTTTAFRAGNANDHYDELHGWSMEDFVSKVVRADTRIIDLIQMEVSTDGNLQKSQFAHSYIGLGFSARSSKRLNTYRPSNRASELFVVARGLKGFRPVNIKLSDGWHELASLTFHNTLRMAKYFKASSNGLPDDGRFEYVIVEAGKHPAANAIKYGYKALRDKLGTQQQATTFSFELEEDNLVQLDGEEMMLSAGSHINISVAPSALRTLS